MKSSRWPKRPSFSIFSNFSRRKRSLGVAQLLFAAVAAFLGAMFCPNFSQERVSNAVSTPESGEKSELRAEFLDANGLRFRRIPAGNFMMGNVLTANQIDRKWPGGKIERYRNAPRRQTTLTRPFYLSRFETTVGQFAKFVEKTGYKTTAEREGNAKGYDKRTNRWKNVDGLSWKNPGFEQNDDEPVVCVSWDDAQQYVDWLNKKTNFEPKLGFQPVYRLPTEAEWEYACRAGSATEFFWGTNDAADGRGFLNGADATMAPGNGKREVFPFNDGYATTAPVGSLKPNAFGLCDMLGNAWEWCADWRADWRVESPTPAVVEPDRSNANPADAARRAFRGGGWTSGPQYCRSAYRDGLASDERFVNLGFRVALSSSE